MPNVSKYGYLILGRRSAPPSPQQLRTAIEQVRKRIDPNGTLAARGQRVLDTVNALRSTGLPKLIINEKTLKLLEERQTPQDVIALPAIEAFIAALNASNLEVVESFLVANGLEIMDDFPASNQKSGKLMLLSGPSAAGKGTLQEKFLIPDGLPKWVFFNIRNRRPDELNGVMYNFVQSEEDLATRCHTLAKMHQDGEFAASAVVHAPEIADIPGKRSQGVGKNLFELVSRGEDWFAEVDLKLAAQLIMRGREQRINVRYVFLLPSSFEDLMGRIIKRTIIKKGGAASKITEKDIESMKNRMINAQGEIAFSVLLNPKYVINAENQEASAAKATMGAFEFVSKKSPAIAEQIGREISGRVTVDKYDRAIQSAQTEEIDPLELLPENYPAIFSIPGEIHALLQSKITALVDSKGKVSVPLLLDLMKQELRKSVWEISGNPIDLVMQIHPGEHLALRQKYTVGIQPGTLAPYHHGHISFAQAALLDGGLAGVTVLSGGTPPEKPFVVTPHHREAMVRLGLIGYPYLHYSPIRVQMAEILKGIDMGGKNEEENRRLRDLAAFSFLISMNPHLKWEYITGVDKVNNYGLSGKNERDLFLDLLIGNNIPLRYYLGGRGELELFEREDAFVAKNIGTTNWVSSKRSLIEQHLLQGTIPSVPISATDVRKMVEKQISLLDVIPKEIIGYIFDHDLRRAYVIENKAKWLQEQLSKNKISKRDAKELLKTINEERSALFELGILADGKLLRMKDIQNL
jgi:guanylate kinase/nicotinic acid mononucleotide adenylyltransferase